MSLPFASRLASKYAPTDEELVTLKLLAAQGDSLLAELDQKIRFLLQQRDEHLQSIDAHKALLAPIRRVPDDILLLIFEDCLPPERNCILCSTEAPILLTHVCASWRTLALGMPSLWATLHIVEPLSFRSRVTPSPFPYDPIPRSILSAQVTLRLEAVRTWLRRTGATQLLSISLDGESSARSAAEPIAFTPQFFDAILPYARRWRDVHFAFWPDPAVTAMLAALIPADLPNLRRLSFENNCVQSRAAALATFTGMFSAFLGAKQLSSVRVRNIRAPIDDPNALRWEQLTELSISDSAHQLTDENVLELLRRCKLVQRCRLGPIRPRNLNDPPLPSALAALVDCPELISLHLETSTLVPLESISCPGLAHLALGPPRYPRGIISHLVVAGTAQFEKFLAHPGPAGIPLTHFSLEGHIREAALRALIFLLPHSLRSLVISDSTSRDSHEFALTDKLLSSIGEGTQPMSFRNLHPSVPLPNLEILELYRCCVLSFKAIGNLLSVRRTLRRARFGYQRYAETPTEMDWRECFRMFVDAGMDLEVSFVPLPALAPNRGILLDSEF
ncbi:F-box domain-containing protein [Mycena kentingensis (nom. inval.)]|nr:F-box domain-containing protein [Mycena kentingensis (nom. inval.)]